MRKRRISIFKPVEPRHWAIPVSEQHLADERKAMGDWEAYCQHLETLGFEQLHCVDSVSHSSLARGGSDRKVETYSLWHHPAGLIGHAHSYTTGGWIKQDGSVEPVRKQLGSFHVDARIDMGTGRESQHRAACRLNGSGGVDPQLDGTNVRNIYDSFHSNTGSLARWLVSVQAYGRFIPLDQWPEMLNQGYFHLPNEVLYPLLEAPEELPSGEDRIQFDDNEALVALCDRLPDGVSQAVKTAAARTGGAQKNRWHNVEMSIDHFSEALGAARKRWRNDFDRQLLGHWNQVALGELGEDIDQWRAFEKGPAGLSLPTALLYAQRGTGAGDRLIKLLEAAPLDVLKRWATQPDAAGYTLGLNAINRQFCERGMIDREPQAGLTEHVLRILYDRLGPEGLPMATKTHSVLGLAVQYAARHANDRTDLRAIEGCFEAFNQVVDILEELGLDWDEVVRWRTYPNTMMKEGMPHYCDVGQKPSDVELRDLLGAETITPSQVDLAGRVRRKRLAEMATEHADEARPARRPGL